MFNSVCSNGGRRQVQSGLQSKRYERRKIHTRTNQGVMQMSIEETLTERETRYGTKC